MKIPVDEIPEPEIDEFGVEVVKPIIAAEYMKDGVRVQELENHTEWSAYTKQLNRNRDAAMLERGDITVKRLREKNGFLSGADLRQAKIVAVGDRKWEDVD
ncbi:hypothetical protein L3V16_21100 [Brucella ciceri]|uniref:hypothetical protein n=1 Tax=Brucella ciceri TaxID=391287 RepID=UPI000DE38AE4|nr:MULTISPECIES: hypothetical protein [Brucella]MCH6206325.1 hypothetical protein [Brucella ciceri]